MKLNLISKYILLSFFYLSACSSSVNYKEKADHLKKQEKYELAIKNYKKHIKDRLEVKNRPEWDNPAIYYLDIGDIFLIQNNPEQAEKYYQLAEEEKVKSAYVNDRYRGLALWYEEQGNLRKSLEILLKYKEKDPFLINLMLDRLAKEIVEIEDKNTKSAR